MGLCGAQNDTGTGFSPRDSLVSLSESFHQLFTLLFIYLLLLPTGQTVEAREPYKEECSFAKW
jgi:hypothetical protein